MNGMKKRLVAVVCGLLMLGTPVAMADRFVVHGDSVQVVDGKDTIVINTAINRLKTKLQALVDDTLINEQLDATIDSADLAIMEEDPAERSVNVYGIHGPFEPLKWIALSFAAAAVVIVFLVLLFSFLRRRAKLRVIEKAIEKNYPLPSEFMGGSTAAPQQPIIVMNQPQAGMSTQNVEQKGQEATIINNLTNYPGEKSFSGLFHIDGPINWNAFKPAVKWLAWGLGLGLFFLFNNEIGLAAVGLVLMLVGLAKAFSIFQNQRYIAWSLKHGKPAEGTPIENVGEPTPPPLNPDSDSNDSNNNSFNINE